LENADRNKKVLFELSKKKAINEIRGNRFLRNRRARGKNVPKKMGIPAGRLLIDLLL